MNRPMIASLCAAGLLCVAAACATQPSAGVAMTEETRTASAQSDDRYCLRRTGTRIDLRRSDRGGEFDKCVAAGGRVYTREDLERTGEVDIADALRKLDPAIQ